jgi:HK97 family phage portal protein
MKLIPSFLRKSKPLVGNSKELFDLVVEIINSASSGIKVTPEQALQVPAFFSSVRVIAEAISHMPFHLLEKDEAGNVKKATDHSLYEILHDLPNSWQSSSEFRQEMMIRAQRDGHAFAHIVRAGRKVKELVPYKTGEVTFERASDGTYFYQDKDKKRLDPQTIFRVSGFTDGLAGEVTTQICMKESIALAFAAEVYGAAFFNNGARPGLIFKHPGKISTEAKQNFLDQIKEKFTGKSSGNNLMLQEGMDVTKITFTNDEAQYLETRKLARSEISGAAGCPPHKIGDLEKATFSNIEQQSLEFYTGSVLHWCVRWEQAVYRDLLTAAERKKYYAKINVDGLLRGDIATRMEAYTKAIHYGIMNANEVRAKEDLNKRSDADGESYFRPANILKEGEVAGGASKTEQNV